MSPTHLVSKIRHQHRCNHLFSYKEAFFSRKIPASERRRARIKELENTLLEHPLMLLPGLEEGLEPELYDEVIDILDPDLLDTIAGADLDSIERNGIIWKLFCH